MKIVRRSVLVFAVCLFVMGATSAYADVTVTASGLEPGTLATCTISGGGFSASDFGDSATVDDHGNAVFTFDTALIPARDTTAKVSGTAARAEKLSSKTSNTWGQDGRADWKTGVSF